MPTRRACTIALNILFLTLFVQPASGQAPAGRAVTGRLIEVKVPAPSLKGNLLGDPAEQSVAMYLPPSYDSSPSKRYPTLYLLHGFGGDSKTWLSEGPWRFN